MRIQPQKSNKKPLYASIAVVVLLIIALATYLFITYPRDNSNDTTSDPADTTATTPRDNDSTTPDNTPDDVNQGEGDTPTKVENKTPVQYEGEQIDDESPVDDERFRIPEEE